MFRFYTAMGVFALTLHAFAQMKGWSVFPSEAQEFLSRRAAETESRHSGSSSGRSGGGGSSSSSGGK
jgi:uncharacterized membrane protein YgcG